MIGQGVALGIAGLLAVTLLIAGLGRWGIAAPDDDSEGFVRWVKEDGAGLLLYAAMIAALMVWQLS